MDPFFKCTGCVTKIRTNFNLNFPLYCASIRGYCWHPRKPDASNKQSYFQNGGDNWNQVRSIIEEPRSSKTFALGAMKIIQFFGYPRSTVYDVAKYTLEQSNESSNIPTTKNHSKEPWVLSTPAVIERAQR